MSTIFADQTLAEWAVSCQTRDLERWVEHLDRVPVCDFFPVLGEQEALTHTGKLLTLSQWLNFMGGRRYDDIVADTTTSSLPISLRLAAATYLRWLDRVETLLRTSKLPYLPETGVVQYFTDHLAASVLIGYRRIGSTIQLNRHLAVPNPEAYLDPVRLLRFAKTPAQLELLRRSLYTRHKVVIQRNTLIHVDRERAPDVFGPAIDTLFLNDWLHANRYARQRTSENAVFFEDPVPRTATDESYEKGQSFVEIGCGNGLLTASFARNEAKIRSLVAVDVSHAAVSTTYENVAAQRQLHGVAMTDRGRFSVCRYNLDAVPAQSRLVVCNPPYIPIPNQQGIDGLLHPLAAATVGTELLAQVLTDSGSLIAPQGELYMVSSTLADPEIKAALPAGMTCRVMAARTVPFDIEAVRGQNEREHVTWLHKERGLKKGPNGALLHDIAIYRITHT